MQSLILWLLSHPDSAIARAAADIEDSMIWTTSDYLLANVVDGLNVIIWQNAGDSKKPQPDPVPRPEKKTIEFSSMEDIKALFGDIKSLTSTEG